MSQCFFEPVRQPSDIFYKDEGGKQNQLVFRIHFVNNQQNPSRSHQSSYYNAPKELQQLADEEGNVSLQAALLLEDGVTPADHDDSISSGGGSILRIVSSTEDKDQKPCFSLQTGYGGIRYRIERVSKRMDGQRYVVLLTIPGLKTLNPKLYETLRIISHPTLVLSKRKNRSMPGQRFSLGSNISSSGVALAAATLTSLSGTGSPREYSQGGLKRPRFGKKDGVYFDDEEDDDESINDDESNDIPRKKNMSGAKDVTPVLAYPRSATGESSFSAAGSLTGLNGSPSKGSRISAVLDKKASSKIASFPIMTGENSRDITSLHSAFMDVQRYCIRLGKEVEELRAALRHIATKSPHTFPPELQKSLSQTYSLDFETIANEKPSQVPRSNSVSSPTEETMNSLPPYSRGGSTGSSNVGEYNSQIKSGNDMLAEFQNGGPSFSKNLDLWTSTLNDTKGSNDQASASRAPKQIKTPNNGNDSDQPPLVKPGLRRDFSSSSIFAGQDIELTPPAFNTRSHSGLLGGFR